MSRYLPEKITLGAKIVFAIPPTAAASERVFSLLEAMFGTAQDASLADLIQGLHLCYATTSARLGEHGDVA